MGRFISSVINIFQLRWVTQSLTWGRTWGWGVTGWGWGWSVWTPTPGFQPSYSRPILSSLPPPPPFFFFFFWGGGCTPAPNSDFFQSPKPILPPPPPLFRQKPPPPPPPPPPPVTLTPPHGLWPSNSLHSMCSLFCVCVCWFSFFVSMALHVLDKIYTSE